MQRVTDHDAGGQAEAFAFTARRSGVVTHASVYIARGSRARRVFVGIYTTAHARRAGRAGHRGHVQVKPGRLITSGSIGPLKPGRWDDVRLARAHLTKGVRYWVALLGVRGRLNFRDSRAGSVSYRSKQTRLAALPTTYAPGARLRSGPASVYVDGIAGASFGSPGSGPGSPGAGSGSPGSPGSGAPAPTHPPAQTCTGTPNIPGGPDPFGGCFPGPNNTGVPAGTTLTTIGSSGSGWKFSDGGLDITSCGVALNGLKIPGTVYLEASASNGTHLAATPCVTISNSEIDGWVDVGSTDGSQAGGPLVLTNDTVDVPAGDDDRSPVLAENYFATGLNVEGGRLGFSCRGYCTIADSYAHGGYLEGQFHYNAVGSNGLNGPLVLEHDSLACDFENNNTAALNAGAGCSDDVGLFGDFGPISNVTVDKSLFVSDPQSYGGVPYCFDGNNPNSGKQYPNATNEVVTNNVFERGSTGKCGTYGPLYSWQNGAGNLWSGNVWDNGTALSSG